MKKSKININEWYEMFNLNEQEKNLEAWIRKEHPEDIFILTRCAAASALDLYMKFASDSRAKEKDIKSWRNLSKKWLKDFYMELPSLDELKRIAGTKEQVFQSVQ